MEPRDSRGVCEFLKTFLITMETLHLSLYWGGDEKVQCTIPTRFYYSYPTFNRGLLCTCTCVCINRLDILINETQYSESVTI